MELEEFTTDCHLSIIEKQDQFKILFGIAKTIIIIITIMNFNSTIPNVHSASTKVCFKAKRRKVLSIGIWIKKIRT